jgi:hypothetical protein
MSKHQQYRGIEKYKEFHDLDPKKIATFPDRFKIPEYMCFVGNAIDVAYHSWKWSDPADYIHDHDSGVKTYLPERGNRQPTTKVPKYIQEADVLVRLGDCLHFTYEDLTGETIEAKCSKPYPKLYTIPSGKALLVISGKANLEAIIWGGSLKVEDVGIVG